MTLGAPNLDDRRFQDLVDGAKRLVQQQCATWSDHNVSDPGVTLIEAFAWMVDQLSFRLNQVPDRLYVKFLELIGVRLHPPTAARAWVTFWLSKDSPTVPVPAGTVVATRRSESEEAIPFTVVEGLVIPECRVTHLGSHRSGGEPYLHGETVRGDRGFRCFSDIPQPGDALLVGLSTAVPSCAVALRFEGPPLGRGVPVDRVPIVWEAYAGDDSWVPCELERDETAGLNREGEILLHVPGQHARLSFSGQPAAGWIRGRVYETSDAEARYEQSPRVDRLEAHAVGGTARVEQAERVDREVIGVAAGVGGERFRVQRQPVVKVTAPVILEVSQPESDGSWATWTRVDDFARSGEADQHFSFDEVSGEVVLGPTVRLSDGRLHQYGAVPAKGATLRLVSYWTGGGTRGNVGAGEISVLKSSIPYVRAVVNREAARGGYDGEDVENAKLRGPLLLHTEERAVTKQDYEQLVLRAAPEEVARAHCMDTEPGESVVRVRVVPKTPDNDELPTSSLIPEPATLEKIARYLDRRRMIGTRVLVEPARFQPFTITAVVHARSHANVSRLEQEALGALYRYFHPVRGGRDGRGWPFGKAVHVSDVHAAFGRVEDCEYADQIILHRLHRNRQATSEGELLVVEPGVLVLSHHHQIRVRPQ
jgi:predicted phage baseplate assembly protein